MGGQGGEVRVVVGYTAGVSGDEEDVVMWDRRRGGLWVRRS